MTSKISRLIAIGLVIFQLGSTTVFSLNDLLLRAIHVMLATALALLLNPVSKNKRKGALFDWALIMIVVLASINIMAKHTIVYEITRPIEGLDMILGAALFLIVLEAARRTAGLPIVILVGIAVSLVYVGPLLPEALRTRGLPLSFLLKNIYFSTSGLYGSTTGLSATILAIFLIFGGILVGTGVGDVFVSAALRIAGKARGGPAKVAIVGSALMGMISGSSMANVVVTGTYTIPMMKSIGYKPEFAAAVEATASTGGTFTPPIMALGAFLMAELLGIKYTTICYHAAFLAFLYYLAIYLSVDLEAKHLGLSGLKSEDLPPWRRVWASGRVLVLIVPVGVLLWLILKGIDLTVAGFWSCVLTLSLFFLAGRFSIEEIKGRSKKTSESLIKGGESIAGLGPLIFASSVLVNLLMVGGITARLIEVVEVVLLRNIWGGLVIGAAVPLILGMAVPPIAAYILSASILAPSLSHFFPPLIVHLYLFFYSCLAQITPPVCGACFVAAAIAKTSWVKTAYISLKLAAVAFIFPIFFMLRPEIIGFAAHLYDILLLYGGAVIGVMLLSVSFFSFRRRSPMNLAIRVLLLISGLLVMHVNYLASVAGLGLAGLVCILAVILKKRRWL